MLHFISGGNLDLSNPKLWKLGEDIMQILRNMPSVSGGESAMFDHVMHGFSTPDKKSADKMPFVCILPPERGSFKNTNGMSIDNIRLSLPIYAYFHIPNPADAIKTMYRFIQLFSIEIQDMNFSWFDNTITVIPKEFALGDVLKSNGIQNMPIKPPFYGVYLNLDIRINDGAL